MKATIKIGATVKKTLSAEEVKPCEATNGKLVFVDKKAHDKFVKSLYGACKKGGLTRK